MDKTTLVIDKDAKVTPELLVEKHNGIADVVMRYDSQLAETQGSLAEIRALVTDVTKEFKDRARRDLGEGLASKLFYDHNVEEALTWDAIHKAPTEVDRIRIPGVVTAAKPAKADDLVGRFQERSDSLMILAGRMRLVDEEGHLKAGAQRLKYYRGYGALREKLAGVLEKDGFQLGVAGSGSEWDPSSFSTRLFELARLPWRLAAKFPTFALPRSPFIFPVELADLVAYLVAEMGTAPPILGTTAGYIPDGKGSTNITSSKTFTSVKLASMAFASKEAEEDLIVPTIPYLQNKLIKAYNNGLEKALLRGFKTAGATHPTYDSDTQGATSACKAFDGLVDYALNVTTLTTKDAGGVNINTDALWRDQIRGARKLLDDPYKADAGELVLVVSGNTAIDVGSCEAFRTAYAMGGMSTNRMGDATGFRPDGLGDFVISAFMRTDLASTGVNSGVPANDVYTMAIQFYPEAWLLGEERALRLEVARERFFEYDVDAVKMTWRGDLNAMLSGKHTVATVNILP